MSFILLYSKNCELASVLLQCPLVRLKDLQPQAARPTVDLSSQTGIMDVVLSIPSSRTRLPSAGPTYVGSGAWAGLLVGPDDHSRTGM